MATPLLENFSATVEETVLDALATTLRDDPVLGTTGTGTYDGRQVTLWLGDSGDPDEEQAADQVPSDLQVPAVVMTIGDYPGGRYTEHQHAGRLRVEFECYSPGLHRNDAFRLTHALARALFPVDADRRAVVKARMNAAGAVAEQIERLGGSPVRVGDSWYAIRSRVVLNVLIHK